MADMWHYTSNGAQVGPVPMTELRTLAASGLVKPTDLVWQEGMPTWIRASAARGLFEDASVPPGAKDAVDHTQGRATRPSRPTANEDDRRPRRRRDRDVGEETGRPRRRPPSDGMGAGAKVAVILGVVILVVGAIVGGTILLVNSSADGRKQVAVQKNGFNRVMAIGQVPLNYSLNLNGNQRDSRTFEFRANTRYEFTITTTVNGMLDFYIWDNNDDVGGDDHIQSPYRHEWTPPFTGSFRIEVHSRAVQAAQVTVSIREIGPGFANNNPPQVMPPPKKGAAPVQGNTHSVGLGGLTLHGTLNNGDARDLGPGGPPCHVYLVRLEAGRTYRLDLISDEIDAFLRLEDGNQFQLAADDDGGGGLNSRLVHRCDRTDVYRVICRPLGDETGRYTLTVRRQ